MIVVIAVVVTSLSIVTANADTIIAIADSIIIANCILGGFVDILHLTIVKVIQNNKIYQPF